MKKITATIVLVLLAMVTISCSRASNGLTEFKSDDFSFKYPAKWSASEHGGKLDRFNGQGIIAVNNFRKNDFWLKPITRSDLLYAGGGLIVKKLPKNGVYMFVMQSGTAGDKNASSKIKAPTKAYGTPKDFEKMALPVLTGIKNFPKDKRKHVQQKWDLRNIPEKWLHYRVEMTNHGKIYDGHIFVIGDSVKKDVKAVESIIKSFELVDPAS
ncbi:MAG: hypothetical protein ACYC56_02885 [Candidatus Aquicultor sp.]